MAAKQPATVKVAAAAKNQTQQRRPQSCSDSHGGKENRQLPRWQRNSCDCQGERKQPATARSQRQQIASHVAENNEQGANIAQSKAAAGDGQGSSKQRATAAVVAKYLPTAKVGADGQGGMAKAATNSLRRPRWLRTTDSEKPLAGWQQQPQGP